MPLGRQFRDTYWHDAEGSHASETIDATPSTPIIHSLPDHRSESAPPLQGMLFSPYAATGLKQDPLVRPGKREETIKDSLDLNSVDKYRRRLASMIPSQRVETRKLDENGQPVMAERRSEEWTVTAKRGAKGAQQDMDLIAKTLDNTDMPTHVIERTVAQPVLDPNEGRAYAEDHSGRVRLTTHLKPTTGWTGGEEVTRPKVTRGAVSYTHLTLPTSDLV